MKFYPGKITFILMWLFLAGCCGPALAAVCDVDNDGDVDRVDLKMIAAANNSPSDGPGDSRDADGDGSITELDLTVCIRQCSVAGCEIVGPVSPAESKSAGSPEAANPAPTMTGRSSDAIQGRASAGKTEWKVNRGDTLFSISRSLIPQDTGKQARLREDIVSLNPSVFPDGASNLAAGAVLKLPGYVHTQNLAVVTDPPRSAPAPAVGTIASGQATPPIDSGPLVTPVPEKPLESSISGEVKQKSALQTGSRDQPAASEANRIAATNDSKANALVSLGYSHGGDRLVDTDGSDDLRAGSGAHLRLGFEHMFSHGGGYRLALGLQYNLARESGDNTTFRDAYLQLAYQHRSAPMVYGIGMVIHTGPTFKGDSTREYDPDAGAVAYLENVGNGALSGWGLSYTYLEIEAQDDSESVDASRVELYYNWRF